MLNSLAASETADERGMPLSMTVDTGTGFQRRWMRRRIYTDGPAQ
jgi:hypothetical protein